VVYWGLEGEGKRMEKDVTTEEEESSDSFSDNY
jgi:hypothetical protein